MPTERIFHSPHQGAHPATRQCLIYFLTGNPGLIDYYTPFLTHLRALLDAIEAQRAHKVTFTLYGRDLAGFDDQDHPAPFNKTDNLPHDVEYEINDCLKHLAAANKIPPSSSSSARAGEPFDEVILMGHSLGTYIALELFHRHLQDPSLAPALHLRAGVLLFATIAHLAKSPKGVLLDALRARPWLARNVPLLAQRLLALLPTTFLRWFVATLLGMPPHAADVTTRFLTSRDGVYQALYLGMDEMAVIGDEAWAEELWEVGGAGDDEARAAAAAHDVPKFFLFFGKKDHWVANEYRDRFIEAREEHAKREGVPVHKRGRTRIVIDEGDLPHDFCLSEPLLSSFFSLFNTSAS